MVKHIILWTLNPELSEEEKKQVKAGIKAGLEGLMGKVPGLIDVKVIIDGRLASSNTPAKRRGLFILSSKSDYFLLIARSIATATDTVAPTIGLLPIPRKPIIST